MFLTHQAFPTSPTALKSVADPLTSHVAAHGIPPGRLTTTSRRESTPAIEELRTMLLKARTDRAEQLRLLPPAGVDAHPVQVAHRASVLRIHAAVVQALQRMESGRYGACTRCGAVQSTALLRSLPWADACGRCRGERR